MTRIRRIWGGPASVRIRDDPTDPDYPSANTISYIYKDDVVTREALAVVDYAKGKKAKTFLSQIGAVPIAE